MSLLLNAIKAVGIAAASVFLLSAGSLGTLVAVGFEDPAYLKSYGLQAIWGGLLIRVPWCGVVPFYFPFYFVVALSALYLPPRGRHLAAVATILVSLAILLCGLIRLYNYPPDTVL